MVSIGGAGGIFSMASLGFIPMPLGGLDSHIKVWLYFYCFFLALLNLSKSIFNHLGNILALFPKLPTFP